MNSKTTYTEERIREGYSGEDVKLWQALCRQCEMEVGDSVKYMWTILDIAQHNSVGPVDIVSKGRHVSGEKAVNQRFMEALLLMVYGDDDNDDDDVGKVQNETTKVLDLTAEESLSGSYEEASPSYYENPNSNEAYEIDGFVVPDTPDGYEYSQHEPGSPNHVEWKEPRAMKAAPATPATRVRVSGLARSNALVRKQIETPAGAVAIKSSIKKRVLESISEEE